MTDWTDDYLLSAYDGLQSYIMDVEAGQARTLGAWLKTAFHPQSVIDVGCGPGLYLLPFKPEAQVIGLDGAPASGAMLEPAEFLREDFRDFLANFRPVYGAEPPHDLALCIEVGEHLPSYCAAPLVAYLCHMAKVVVFSAATVGQGGLGHINCQLPAYWRGLFAAQGYMTHPLENDLREALAHDPACVGLGWLIHNVMLLAPAPGKVEAP